MIPKMFLYNSMMTTYPVWYKHILTTLQQGEAETF